MIRQMAGWAGMIAMTIGLPMCTSVWASAPKPAPTAYATPNYALTFTVPHGLSYCPMPADWIGSDHGTTLFLAPPVDCGGAGYASSGRSFMPARTPRIEVYYGWWSNDDNGPFPRHPCRRPLGHVRTFGRVYPLCPVGRGGLVGVELHVHYRISSPGDAEAIFTLLTTPKALPHDLRRFEQLVGSARGCTPKDAEKGFGSGASCSRSASWF